jgi:Tol biopolymer transport system component
VRRSIALVALAVLALAHAAGAGVTPADWRNVTVSPDGTQIAFTNGDDWKIWVARPDGSDAHVLAPAPTDEGVSDMHWTQDGLLVDSNFTVYQVRPGRKARVVISGKHGGFTFADGGTRVATGLERAPGPYFVADVVSGKHWQLGSPRTVNNTGSISPDGTRVAWSSAGGVWIARLGGAAHRLAAAAACPTWSPDGMSLSFMRLADLRVISASGGKSRLLAANVGGCQQTAWSPDGTAIAYGGPRGVIVVNARTGAVRHVARSLGDTYGPAWAPDGTLYLSSRPKRDDGGDCLDLATAAGAVVVRGCP